MSKSGSAGMEELTSRGVGVVFYEAEEEFLRRELEGWQYVPVEYLDGLVKVVWPRLW